MTTPTECHACELDSNVGFYLKTDRALYQYFEISPCNAQENDLKKPFL